MSVGVWLTLTLCLFLWAMTAQGRTKLGPKTVKKAMKVTKAFDSADEEGEESGNEMNSMQKALRQSLYEQEVEDLNALHKIDNHLVRRLIVMPLTDAFKPHAADQMHGKIQYGDKCSLPTTIGRLIFEKRYEVPWIFELLPVRKVTSEFAPRRLQQGVIIPTAGSSNHQSSQSASKPSSTTSGNEEIIPKSSLNKAYISPLDFRSPENYIFLPRWMMSDLGLKTNDLVDISLVRIKLAELVVFQPLSLDWDELMEEHKDPKALLEHEINKYSSLTAGSTIYINIKGKEYPLYVKETFAEGGISVQGVRVQDSDVRTDIDRSVLDKLIKIKEGKQKK